MGPVIADPVNCCFVVGVNMPLVQLPRMKNEVPKSSPQLSPSVYPFGVDFILCAIFFQLPNSRCINEFFKHLYAFSLAILSRSAFIPICIYRIFYNGIRAAFRRVR